MGLDELGAAPHDLVVFSDLDEIPRASTIAALRICDGFVLPASLHTPNYMYDVGCRLEEPPHWERIRVARR